MAQARDLPVDEPGLRAVPKHVARIEIVVADDTARVSRECGDSGFERGLERGRPGWKARAVLHRFPRAPRVRERIAFDDARRIERVQLAQARDQRSHAGPRCTGSVSAAGRGTPAKRSETTARAASSTCTIAGATRAS